MRRAAGYVVLVAIAMAALAALLAVRARPSLPRVTVEDGGSRVESCLSCHAGMRGLGAPHDPAKIGCSACHLGDPTQKEEARAHAGMILLTGDLSTVFATCGRASCHLDEAVRVSTSLMAGAPGILAVDRFAFGERSTPDVRPEDDLRSLSGEPKSAAEDHARKLCGSCHLAARKAAKGDRGFESRGGGCTACHLNAPLGAAADVATGPVHPGVSADVSEHHCEGCHARSGRVALSFRGVAEVAPARATRHLPDGRPATDAPGDVHARAGMTCIDCHTERDVMGDGERHEHASDAVEIRCVDCHGETLVARTPSVEAAARADRLRRSWDRRGLPSLARGTPILTARGTPLFRTDAPTRTLRLATTGVERPLPALGAGPRHRLQGHERLSCQACHSVWAPRCPTCHTTRDARGADVDHLTGQSTAPAWREGPAESDFGLPALARGSHGLVAPFVEGMSLRVAGLPQPIERELWAPLDPHTTGQARACASCHPGDAATYPPSGETTRVGASLLAASDRARVARVGACVPCHGRYDDPVWRDPPGSFARLARRAATPPGDAVRRCKGR